MKTYRILVVIGLIGFLACNEKLIEKPDNLIPRNKMVALLKDLAIMNAAKATNVTYLREHHIDPTQFLFDKYGIDSMQFVESDRYYASMPIQYKAIYIEIDSLLEKEKKTLEEVKKINDSIKLQEREALETLNRTTDTASLKRKKILKKPTD